MSKARFKTKLRRFPAPVLQEFDVAWDEMRSALDEARMEIWAQTGLEMAGHTVRSWEAANQYFRSSPSVVAMMPFSYFVKWSQCGSDLCRESPTLAAAYFEASPGAMGRLRSRHIETWARLGSSLYKGTWKSSTLSSKFFESSPALLRHLTVPEMERFATFLEALSHRSYDLALECLVLAPGVFPHLGENKDAFMALSSMMVEKSWRQVKSLFDACSKALAQIDAPQRGRFLRLADSLIKLDSPNVPAVMLEIGRSLSQIDRENHARLLELAEELTALSAPAMAEFVRNCPHALERVTMAQLERWFQDGVGILRNNRDGGLAFFRVESAHSQELLEALSSSVEFDRIKDLMETYCRALAGAEVELAAAEELVEKNIGWVSAENPATEGSTVYVPSQVDRYPTKDENFGWFKVVSTHQVAHLEFGSFKFVYDRPSTVFRDLRPNLDGAGPSSGENAAGEKKAWATDMQRFFDLFEDRQLALDIFTVVEDGRLDARLMTEYPGIKGTYLNVQRDSLKTRPEIRSLPMREAMVEFLVRVSLQQGKKVPVPREQAAQARRIARILRRLVVAGATVEDAAEATLRVYAIISQVANRQVDPEDWDELDLDQDQEGEESEEEGSEAYQQLLQQMDAHTAAPGDQGEYSPVQDVDYRGDLKPELVQLMAALRSQGAEQPSPDGGEGITQQMLEEMVESSVEIDLQAGQGEEDPSGAAFADNMLKELGMEMPASPEMGQGPLVHVEEAGGALEPTEPQTFVYDEWDFRAADFKPRWCIVRQKTMAEGDPAYYGTTLHGYAPLVNQIKRQFEMMVPEVLRKVRKLEDGEEIDIDDVIEAFIDIKTGVGPSEKLFWRRNKVQRDVAVVFLLDTSASTAEAIDEGRKVVDDWEAPDDPVEYMVWLRSRRSEGMRRSYKRIIDLEKEAVVLLINALESIGDVYGIYGFSGYGRENVEFYNIKDIDEQLTDRVKSRIDRITPLHATRMGPAIRHATTKLEAQDSRTKLLFLISDGRPQDRGYSREGVEKEYAVHDTKMALDEARQKDVTAFCLTVDKNGHDYLGTMCQDIGYEVLDDIYSLPRRLLYLYKRLTM